MDFEILMKNIDKLLAGFVQQLSLENITY